MTDTKLKQIGPGAGQLSRKLSFTEKTQIGAIRNTGSSLSATPGVINGPVSKTISNLSNTDKSKMSIAGDIASKLEQAGAVRKNSRDFISKTVPKSVSRREALHYKKVINPADPKYRTSNRRLSVDQVIRRNKNDILGQVIEELGLTDVGYEGISFPNDLDSTAPVWLTLNFLKYSKKSAETPGIIQNSNLKINLPLPENFTVSSNIRLQEQEAGIYGDILRTVDPTAISSLSDGRVTQAAEQVKAQLAGLSNQQTATAISEVARRSGFASLSSADAVVGGLAGQIKGAIPNPHPTVFFKGVDLRQFQWNWKLVPRSKSEADKIKAIIMGIRKAVIPKAASNSTFLDYPNLIKPVVNTAAGIDNEIYGNFRKSMVNQFTVNFSGEGTSAYFVDGSPVAINLGLNFMEVENYSGTEING